MGALGYYLIIINVIGFILFVVNTWLYSHTVEGQEDKFLTITALLCGSPGILLSILLFDRKAIKGNMIPKIMIPMVVEVMDDIASGRINPGDYIKENARNPFMPS